MSAKTVTIDHPHAEVIAAYYSGKTVQASMGSGWLDYTQGKHVGNLTFDPSDKWRIKPEPLVLWAVVFPNGAAATFADRRDADGYVKEGQASRIARMVEQPE